MNLLITTPAEKDSCLFEAVSAQHSFTISTFNETTESELERASLAFTHRSVNLVTLKEVTIGGLGLIARGNNLLLPENIFPQYLRSSLDNYLRYSSQNRAVSGARVWLGVLLNETKQRLHLEKAGFCLHPNLVYGHFLTEILPKLLVFDEFLPEDIPLIIPSSGPVWLENLVKEAVPRRPLYTYDHKTHVVDVETLYSIENLFDGSVFHPQVQTFIDSLVGRLTATRHDNDGKTPPYQRQAFYVSRSKVKRSWHRLCDENLVQDIFESEGFRVIHPETMSFRNQVTLFANSSSLVGEYSSAMHNAMFATSATEVICLNRINSYQEAIARMKNQTLGFITPKEGAFLTWRDHAIKTQIIDFDFVKLRRIARALRQFEATT